jgi:hypothetical protein
MYNYLEQGEKMLAEVQTSILGLLIVELLNGTLSDETIAAVDSIKRDSVPGPLNNLVGMIHGMSTHPPLRESQITSLLGEVYSAVGETLEKRTGQPVQWYTLFHILEQIMQGGEYDIRGTADMFADVWSGITDRNPAWAQPMLRQIHESDAQEKELELELLEVLETQIQKRRTELK